MAPARTCPQCGHMQTAGQIWRQLSRQLGWRITCPGCGRACGVSRRERLVSALYFVVAPWLLLMAASLISLPLSTRVAGLWILVAYLLLALVGSALAARRLRLS